MAFDLGVEKMGAEAKETKEMAHLFFHLLEHKLNINERSELPTDQEIREAHEHFNASKFPTVKKNLCY